MQTPTGRQANVKPGKAEHFEIEKRENKTSRDKETRDHGNKALNSSTDAHT